jgi:hypothetical protein
MKMRVGSFKFDQLSLVKMVELISQDNVSHLDGVDPVFSFIMSNMVILQCNHILHSGLFEYIAVSPFFDEVEEGSEPPGYIFFMFEKKVCSNCRSERVINIDGGLVCGECQSTTITRRGFDLQKIKVTRTEEPESERVSYYIKSNIKIDQSRIP